MVAGALTVMSCEGNQDASREQCATGTEDCSCYGNDSCNAPFVCVSARCARDDGQSPGGATSGGSDGGHPLGGAQTNGGAGFVAGDGGVAGDGSTGGASGGSIGDAGDAAFPGAGGAGDSSGCAGKALGAACSEKGDTCDGAGNCVPSWSCAGELTCQGVSCCSSLVVPGGELAMGQSDDGSDALCPDGTYGGYYCTGGDKPEHAVTVDSFSLDTFEVTVARFRNFVSAFDGTPPVAGAGAHPQIAFSGWQSKWNDNLPSSRVALTSNLKCALDDETWTDSPGLNEQAAINCVSWFEAFAFCAWDGGYLPTEAEWEYAAAGGAENRMFPWGSANPAEQVNLANDAYNGNRPTIAVGSEHPQGDGKWGHRDLAGGMAEWALDMYNSTWYSSGGSSCDNCANLNAGAARVARGGSWVGSYPWAGGLSYVIMLRAADRAQREPASRDASLGFRCARND